MLDQNTIERVIDAADILDVVSDFVSLKRAGSNYKGLCPFHDDKTPSFMVSPSKGICKCFACGEGGNAVHFTMKIKQITFIEAIKDLGKRYNIEVEDLEMTDEQRKSNSERESMFAVNEWASQYFRDMMLNTQDGRAIGLAYFRSRGFRDDIIEKFRLGFSLDSWDAMSKAAIAKGFNEKYLTLDPDTLIGTGLSFKRDNKQLTDKYRNRVMFPWFNVSGKVVAFGGRVLDSRTKGVSQKYINSSESLIYHKGRELYGLYQAKSSIAKEDRVYMVEGYTDVLSMHQCGIENVVANSGTALTQEQIHLLHRFTSNITLLYDGDEAGIHAALRGTDMLLANGMSVKVLLLPDGDDPDSFARKHNAQEFKEYVEAHQTDFLFFKANLMKTQAQNDPMKRAEFIKSIIYSISVIPDEIVRSVYIHECAEILRMKEDLLTRDVVRNMQAAKEQLEREQRQLAARQQRMQEAQATTQTSAPQATPQPSTNLQSAPVPSTDEQDAMDAYYAQMAEEEARMAGAHQPATSQQAVTTAQQAAGTGVQAPANQTAAGTAMQYDSAATKENQRFIGLEKMIMTLIVRHGDKIISGTAEDGTDISITLLQFVCNELDNDSLSFYSPIYRRMLDTLRPHINEPGMVPSRILQCSTDMEINQEAANLMIERYQLFNEKQIQAETDLAPDQAEHLMLDYKYTVVETERHRCTAMLQTSEVLSSPERTNETLAKLQHLSTLQRMLARRLGDRVIRK